MGSITRPFMDKQPGLRGIQAVHLKDQISVTRRAPETGRALYQEHTPIVITPLDEHMGLDIARSLGKRGIPIYGIDADPKAPGKYSKYVHFVQSPDPEKDDGSSYIQFLVDFGKKLGGKAVLYPLSDRHVLLCSQERSALEEFYAYVMPDHETVIGLTTKDGLHTIAEKFNIPAPQTIFLRHGDEVQSIAESLHYPVILKPTESTYWHEPRIASILRSDLLAGRAKVIVCHNAEALIKAYQLIAAYDHRLVIQEVIPGEDSRLAYISFYFDRQSRPLGIFAGRKYRVIPTGFGSASYVRSMVDPELEKAAFELLNSVGYQGLGGIEFKKDARDERYKLIEFNPRFGMWDGLGAKCGVDLAYLAYCDALHLPVDPVFSYREDVIWVDWQRDTRAAVEYMRKGELAFGEWMRSLWGEKMWAIYSRDDWRPGAAFTLSLAQKMWDRIRSK
jgi:D-aspartate ligase